MAEKKISPKQQGSKSSSKGAATRVTKRQSLKKKKRK